MNEEEEWTSSIVCSSISHGVNELIKGLGTSHAHALGNWKEVCCMFKHQVWGGQWIKN
jgi:hypothetical protein